MDISLYILFLFYL